jgi:outer membrane beta-barrel protein
MKLGFMHRVNGETIAMRRFFARLPRNFGLVAALGVTLLCSTVHAQDMSFDLNETETAKPKKKKKKSQSGQTQEAQTPAAEPAPQAGQAGVEAQGEASQTGDVLTELTADGGPTQERSDAQPAEREVAEEIYAVQRMSVVRHGRFELAPSMAFTFNDPYVTHPALSIGLNYWVTNVLAVGANFMWYQGVESESDLNFSVRRSARLAVPITEYQLGAHLNFTYVPIYGKFSMFNDSIFQWDSYLIGGVGMMRTRPVPVVDPAVRTFDFDWRVAFNAGIGVRVFITRFFTIFGELRDYIYLERLENLTVELGPEREDPNTWTDPNSTLTNNVTAHIGVTMFFPFDFEYRYPK